MIGYDMIRCPSITHRHCIETDKDIFFLGLIAPLLWFSNTTYGCEILAERGACHLDALRYFRLENT